MNVYDQLRAKYPADRYALFFEVPDAVSLDARRRIDAVAVGIWRSVGRNITGFEFKSSRSDWLREVKSVDKADAFVAICDYFFLVTSDASIAKLEEIPATWGWMTCTPNGLRVQKPAVKVLTDKSAVSWGFTVGLLRKLQDSLMDSPDVQSRIEQIRKGEQERADRAVANAGDEASRKLRNLRAVVKQFEDASGLSINDWQAGNIGEVVKSLMDLGWSDRKHGADFIAHRFEESAKGADEMAATARRIAAQLRERSAA